MKCAVLVGLDAATFPKWVRDLGAWQLLCAVNAPVMALKTAISLVHLVAGARMIVQIDLAERADARKEEKKKDK